METQQDVAEELRQQTKALRSLYNLGLAWTVVAVLGLFTWLFVALAR